MPVTALLFRARAGLDVIKPGNWSELTSRSVATGAATVVATLFFYLLRNACIRFYTALPDYLFLLAIAFLAAALCFRRITYSQFSGIFSVLTRVTALGIVVFLIVEPPGYALVHEDRANLSLYIDWGYWVALACAVASLFRPSFLFPAALYTISTRYLSIPTTGFKVSDLDIRYLIEMAQFLSLTACGLAVLPKAVAQFSGTKVGRILALIDRQQLAQCLAFVAFGFHLGNYYWSGYEKLLLGPYPWTWLVENQTQNVVIHSLERGLLVTGTFPATTQWLFDKFGAIVIFANFAVLSAQLFAVVAPLRLRGLMLVSLFYDAFHLGIYLLGGLFFWPWIWNNVSIMLAVKGRSDQEVGWLPKICGVLTVLSGFTNALGGSANLAWFDVLHMKIPIIQAQAPDGRWVNVPFSFFMNLSQTMSMGLPDRVWVNGHYPPTIGGAVSDYNSARLSGQCPAPVPPAKPVESTEQREVRLKTLNDFLRAHHKKMIELTQEYGRHFYYFRSHHHPSNPLLYSEFESLDLKAIHKYRLVTQSFCLGLSNGELQRHWVRRDEVDFNLQ